MEKPSIGLNPQSQIHYTDHLAPVCCLMDIPLLFIDELDYRLGSKYYPGLKTLKVDYHEFSPEYLASQWDVFFLSDLWDRRTFHEKFGPLEKKYNKQLRHVHCPHGYSDKAFYLMKAAMEDVLLIYGDAMIDMLKSCNVFEMLNRYVVTGNYRYAYYLQHRAFYDKLFKEEVLSRFAKNQPTILYAPTWLDLEEATTFFDAHEHVLDQLPNEYNMIVKLHPRLELDDAGMYYYIIGRYEKKPNVIFLKDYPLIFPLLAHTDIFISDMSSVGYDLLPFNKPMFFLNKQRRNSYLYRCGVAVMPEHYSTLYSIIAANLEGDAEHFTELRRETFRYAFGEVKPFETIKKEIIAAYNS